MIGDEDWTYQDGVAALVGVRILCPDCGAVTHIGNTSTRGYFDVARDHMAVVDGITAAEANRVIASHFSEWEERSRMTWAVAVAVAPELLAKYPDLSLLVGHVAGPGDGALYS